MPGDVCPAYNSSISKTELEGLGARWLARLIKASYVFIYVSEWCGKQWKLPSVNLEPPLLFVLTHMCVPSQCGNMDIHAFTTCTCKNNSKK